MKDLDDEKMLMFQQNKEEMQSKQAIYLHQIEDSKRRQLELEEQVKEQKHEIEELKAQNQHLAEGQAPSRDNPDGGNSDQVVSQLQDQIAQMQLEIESLEETNMENVVVLKEENKKLQKKLKEAQKGETSPVPTKSSNRQKQMSSRETAALSVEHEMLSKQVAQMKEYLKANEGQQVPGSPTPNMEESMTYASTQQALS